MDDLDSVPFVESVWDKTFQQTFNQTKGFLEGCYNPSDSCYLKWKNS